MDGQELAKQTLDQIPQASPDAKRIVGLVKEAGRITGYQLSDDSFVEKQQAVNMAKQGQIAGVGIAHRGDEYSARDCAPRPLGLSISAGGIEQSHRRR